MKNIFKNKKIIPIALSIFVFSYSFAFAESSCSVDPFITKITEGDTANIHVLLNTDDVNAPFELNLGNLPDAVESGFLNKEKIENLGNTKKVPLIVQTKQGAQIGSFMISIVYKVSQGEEFVCQFNLDIKKGNVFVTPKTGQVISQETTKNISSGVFPVNTNAPSSSVVVANPETEILIKKEKEENLLRNQIESSSSIFIQNNLNKERLALSSTGEEVKSLQKVLQTFSFFPKNEEITGYFGQITEKAVKEFQTKNGIDPLGIVGPKTREALKTIAMKQEIVDNRSIDTKNKVTNSHPAETALLDKKNTIVPLFKKIFKPLKFYKGKNLLKEE